MTTSLSGPQALRRLREVVGEKPGEVADCVYATYEGQPVCIVGYVLQREGVDLTDLVRCIDTARRLVLDLGGDEDAAWILDAAQRRQDLNEPWSSALEAAESEAAFRGVVA